MSLAEHISYVQKVRLTLFWRQQAMQQDCTSPTIQLTDEVRANIAQRGEQFVEKLDALRRELSGLITKVQGTGLLFSCELSHEFKCYGEGSIEEYMREAGIGVIHGGENSLRFTPHFTITEREVDLVIEQVKLALLNGPRKRQAAAA